MWKYKYSDTVTPVVTAWNVSTDATMSANTFTANGAGRSIFNEGIVVNESGIDSDFRVEWSSGNAAHMDATDGSWNFYAGDISTTGTGTFGEIIDNGLSTGTGVYTDGSKQLTSTPPIFGTLGYWGRTGTTLFTANSGDIVALLGTLNIDTLTASLGVYTNVNKTLTSTPPAEGVLGHWNRSITTVFPSNSGDDIVTTGDLDATTVIADDYTATKNSYPTFTYVNSDTSINDGDPLAKIMFWGTDSFIRKGAEIEVRANNGWGSGNFDAPTAIGFKVQQNGAAGVLTDALVVIDGDNQGVSIGIEDWSPGGLLALKGINAGDQVFKINASNGQTESIIEIEAYNSTDLWILDASGNVHLKQDNAKHYFGASDDYSIEWDGSDAVHTITAGDFVFAGGTLTVPKVQVNTSIGYGVLNLEANDSTIYMRDIGATASHVLRGSGNTMIWSIDSTTNGAININTMTFEADGDIVAHNDFTVLKNSHMLSDGGKTYFGAGNDVSFHCDGTHLIGTLSGTSGAEEFQIKDSNNVTRFTVDSDGDFGSFGSNLLCFLDSADNSEFEIDKGGASYRGSLIYSTAGSENWIMGMTDSDVIGDGTEFWLSTNKTSSAGAKLVVTTAGAFDFQAGDLTTTGEVTANVFDMPTTADATTGVINQNNSPLIHTYGTENLFIGGAGNFTLTDTTRNTGIGIDALAGLTNTGGNNVAIGYGALDSAQTVSQCFALGTSALGQLTTGSGSNTAIGTFALLRLDTGYNNLGFGRNVGVFVDGGAHDNVLIGNYIMGNGLAKDNVDDNVMIGSRAGHVLSAEIKKNTIIGHYAAYAALQGDGNIFIGHDCAYGESRSNKLYIENTNTSTPLIYGEFDNDLLRIYGDLEVSGTTLGAEVLSETDFATHAKWDTVGDFDDTGGDAEYIHSGGSGTLTQTAANMATPLVGNTYYTLTYTTSGFSGTFLTYQITTGILDTALTIPLQNNTHTITFKTKAVPGDFVISITSSVTCDVTIDNISLKPITDFKQGTITSGLHHITSDAGSPNTAIKIEENSGGEYHSIGETSDGDLAVYDGGTTNLSLLIKDGVSTRYTQISQGHVDLVTTSASGWAMAYGWIDDDGTQEIAIWGDNNDDITLGKTRTDRDRWVFDGPTGEVRMYGTNPSIEQHVERSAGGFGYSMFDGYANETGEAEANLFQFGVIGTAGTPSTILYAGMDVDDGSPSQDTANFKFDVDGRMSIGNKTSRTKPTNTLEINQADDSDGVMIKGYDDKSSSTLHSYIDSTGLAHIESTDGITTGGTADVVQLTVKGNASQSANLLNLTDSASTNVFEILSTGHLLNTDGLRTTAAQYGPAIWTHIYGESTPEHTNQTGAYDHTGGANGEQIFTKTAGDDFAQADEDNGNWILLTGANLGAVAEIKEYISTTQVIVDGMGWTGDLASQTFSIYKHPGFVTGNAGEHEFSVESSGEFEIHSYDFTSSTMSELSLDAAANDIDTLKIEVHANGYSGCVGQRIVLDTGTLGAAENMSGITVAIDDSEAAGADSTTIIAANSVQTVNASDATQWGYSVLPGFDEAFKVFGDSAIDPTHGYEVDSSGPTVTDRVNGGAGDGNAFLEAGNDLEIFDDVNDYILIGNNTAVFEIIQVTLDTGASKDCDLDFYYSKTGDNWTALTIRTDGTNGFQNSGFIVFDDPGDWTMDDEAEVNGDITNAYYIKIVRTYAPNIPTLPKEDYFKTFSSQAIGMEIRGDGVVDLPYLGAAPANLDNGMIWMEADGLHIYYGGAEKIVAGV